MTQVQTKLPGVYNDALTNYAIQQKLAQETAASNARKAQEAQMAAQARAMTPQQTTQTQLLRQQQIEAALQAAQKTPYVPPSRTVGFVNNAGQNVNFVNDLGQSVGFGTNTPVQYTSNMVPVAAKPTPTLANQMPAPQTMPAPQIQPAFNPRDPAYLAWLAKSGLAGAQGGSMGMMGLAPVAPGPMISAPGRVAVR